MSLLQSPLSSGAAESGVDWSDRSGGPQGTPAQAADPAEPVATGARRVFGAVPMVGRHPDWVRLYEQVSAERLPWYCPALDPDLAAELDRRGLAAGRFLDIGTGSGHQAVALAERGFQVTATDVSPAAIQQAARLPHPPGRLAFVVDDVRASAVRGDFEFAFDRGCLHVLTPEERPAFVRTVAGLVRAGGLLFLKCVSSAEGTAAFGPERFAESDLAALFAGTFTLELCVPTVFQGPLPHQPRSLFAVLRRLA